MVGVKKSNKKNYILLYYFLLALPFLLWNGSSEPPMLIRMSYLAAVIVPCFFQKEYCYPAILTFFMLMSNYGYSYALLPYQLFLYPIISVIPLLFIRGKSSKPYFPLVLLFCYTTLLDFLSASVSAIDGSLFNNAFFCYLLIIIFFFNTIDERRALNQVGLAFVLMSIFMSFLFLTSGDRFESAYNAAGAEDLTRIKWVDPNYFGCMLGMGTAISMIQLFLQTEKAKFEKWVYLLSLVLSIPVLVMNASRGAVLAVGGVLIILVLFSHFKTKYKILIVGVVGVFLLMLLRGGFFDLLLFRIQNDTGGGSNRTEIWISKLNYFKLGSPISMLFGYGLIGGQYISGTNVGFHNDFIAFLVCYGVVGLALFLYLLISLFAISKKKDNRIRLQLICCVAYLVLCCSTLEPITSGFIAYYIFLFYIILIARSKPIVQESTNQNI